MTPVVVRGSMEIPEENWRRRRRKRENDNEKEGGTNLTALRSPE